MKTNLYLLIAFIIFPVSNIIAQIEQPISVFLSNGDSISGKLQGDLFNRPDIKIVISESSKRIQKSKVDSLVLNNQKYYSHKSFLITNLIRNIDNGVVPLFEVDNKLIAIRRKNNLHIIPKKNYDRALYLFTPNYSEADKKIDRKEFISKINSLNQKNTKDLLLPFDTIINSSKSFLVRLSILRPEVGFEVKLLKSLSFYNSFGLNFYGNAFRDVQTFINYDYSGEIRYYYSQSKRKTKGKSNYNFSGPFVTGTYKYLIDTNVENKNVIGLLHGWQESNIFNNTYGGFRIGAGYDLTNKNVLILSMLNLGWTF